MDSIQAIIAALRKPFSVMKQELPRFMDEPQAEGFKGVLNAVVPQDLTDVGLMLATGATGKVAKLGGAALAGLSYSPEAEAGATGSLIKALRTFPFQKHLPADTLQMLRSLVSKSRETGNEVFHPGYGQQLYTSGASDLVNIPEHVRTNMMLQKPAMHTHTHPTGSIAAPSEADLLFGNASPTTAGLILTPEAKPSYAMYGAKGQRRIDVPEFERYATWAGQHAKDNRALDWAEMQGFKSEPDFADWLGQHTGHLALRDLETRGKINALYRSKPVQLDGQQVPGSVLSDEFYADILK
jgi:hypothetical protein